MVIHSEQPESWKLRTNAPSLANLLKYYCGPDCDALVVMRREIPCHLAFSTFCWYSADAPSGSKT